MRKSFPTNRTYVFYYLKTVDLGILPTTRPVFHGQIAICLSHDPRIFDVLFAILSLIVNRKQYQQIINAANSAELHYFFYF